jgi:hypothetical protein
MDKNDKQYIDEEIEKSNLRLIAESERIQRIVSESRLNFYIKLFTAIGATVAIILPIALSFILSSQNRNEFDRLEQKIEKQSIEVSQRLNQKGSDLEQRLDSAISSMNSEIRKDVNEFSKYQTKSPKFSATLKGKPLDGQLLELSSSSYYVSIAIINNGEGTAKNIGLTLYCSDSTFFDGLNQENEQWFRLPFVDEPLFKSEHKYQMIPSVSLSPQEPYPLNIGLGPNSPDKNANAMLKITYEQGAPKKIYFKVRFKK